MPVLLPIAAWATAVAASVATAGTAFTAVYAVTYAVITAVASGVVSYGVSALLGGGSKPTSGGTQIAAAQGSDEGFRHVVGRARVYGVRVWPTPYPITFKGKNDDTKTGGYGQFQVLSATPVTSIDEVFSDDEALNLVPETRTGGPSLFWAVDQYPFNSEPSLGNSYFYVNYGTGDADPGPRDDLLGWFSDNITDQDPFWPMDATPDGVAWLSSAAFNNKAPPSFPQGPPRLSALVTGIPVYDPRISGHDPLDDSTWEWSDNSALIAAWFITRPFGFAATYDDIDIDTLIVAANDCDEWVETFESALFEVETGGSPIEERKYRCWGEIVEGDDRDGTLAAICATMAGGWAEVAGKWYLFAGAFHTPSETIDDEWVFGGIIYVPQGEIEQAINTLSGTFLSPTNRWQQVAYPRIVDADSLAEVGGNPVEDALDLVMVPSHTQAQRIAAIEIKRRKLGRTIRIPTHLGFAMRIRPGEIVNLNLPDYAIVDEPFRVEKWNLTVAPGGGEDEEGGGQLIVEIELREEREEGYTVGIHELTDLPASPAFELPDWGGGDDDNPIP